MKRWSVFVVALCVVAVAGLAHADDVAIRVRMIDCSEDPISGMQVHMQQPGESMASDDTDSEGYADFTLYGVSTNDEFDVLFDKTYADFMCGPYWVVGCAYVGPPGGGSHDVVISTEYRVHDNCQQDISAILCEEGTTAGNVVTFPWAQ